MPGRRFALLLLLFSPLELPATERAAPPMNHSVSPDSKAFRLEGRIDQRTPDRPVLIWSGTRVILDFSGSAVAVRFGELTGQCVFDLRVDERTELVDLRSTGDSARYVWPHALEAGRHRLELFKRSEASKGHVEFLGVETDGEAGAAPREPSYRLRMEFFGDSITAGACNEDGAIDQWEDFRTHNHALSYDYLTSLALEADHRAMAISGMGVVTGFEAVKAGQTWDRLYPRPDSPPANLHAWYPDIAFVNLGENDAAFTATNGQPFPAQFAAEYVRLVRAIRSAYPHAHLILLRGGMHGGAKNADLIAAWTSAVNQLESSDPGVSHFVFRHWSALHPRVADHRAMAAELTAWLKEQPFMIPLLMNTK